MAANFQQQKYEALDVLDQTKQIWKTHLSQKVSALVSDLEDALKKEDIASTTFLLKKLKDTNSAEINLRKQTQEVKVKLIHDIDLADNEYKENRSFEFNFAVNEAKRLTKKQKAELPDLKNAQLKLENCLQEAKKNANSNKEEALAEANKKALLENEIAKKPESISFNLPKLASFPPDSKGENLYRPDWIDFDKKLNIWKVNPNTLANDIIEEFAIRRIEEKGKLVGYIYYHRSSGLWESMTPEGLGNFVDEYFSTPDKFSGSSSRQYAEDLHTAKAVKDTLTLLKSKIQKIDPKTTFDTPAKFLVHFKNYVLDVSSFELIQFNPKQYFLSGLNSNLEENIFNRIVKVLNGETGAITPEHVIGSIAPITKKWLLQSLGGDNDTLIAFLERLGLSMLHDYSDNFIVFIRGNANTGKSMLFNYLHSLFLESNVSALDLDLMARSNSFDAKELRYKTINLTSETKATSIDETALNILEQLSGGDLRNYSQKFKDTADFVNFAHLWFNMNEFPQLAQFDNAFARRADVFEWHVIPDFEQKFDWKTIQEERPQLILLALYYAHLLLTRKEYFHYAYCGNVDLRLTRSQNMIDLYQDWAKDKDYFTNFVKANCQLNPSYRIGCGELLKNYNRFLREFHKEPVTQKQLTELLLQFKVSECKNKNWKDAKAKWHRNVYIYQGITTNETAGIQNEEISFEKQQYNAGAQRAKRMLN